MYQQVQLNPNVRKYQGFSIPQENGEIRHYVFTVLMFGISIAVYVVTKLLRPVRNFFRSLNIRYNVYIDDSQLCAETAALAESQTQFCITVFKCLGWDINYKKSQLTAQQQIVYLGFLIDSTKMMYFYPERKIVEIKTLFAEIFDKVSKRQPIHLKLLAKLLGKLCAMRISHGKIVIVFTRKCQHILGKQVYLNGWESYCKLDEHAVRELTFLHEHIDIHNGQKMFRPQRAIKILSASYCVEHISDDYNTFVSDSSQLQSFVYNVDESFSVVNEFIFTPYETNLSSSHRELLSIIKTLEKDFEWFEKHPGLIYWLTDSKNVHNFLNRGSRKPEIQRDVVTIKILEKKFNILIVPIWSPRTDVNIQLADVGSKMNQNSDEWSIDQNSYKFIESQFSICFTLDCFATEKNSKCNFYFSKIPQCNSKGINFFMQDLTSNHTYWMCPPVSLISRAIKYLLLFPCVKAVLYVPIWSGQPFWFDIFDGIYFKEFIQDYLILSPFYSMSNDSTNTTFVGFKRFNGMAIFIDSSKRSKILFPHQLLRYDCS